MSFASWSNISSISDSYAPLPDISYTRSDSRPERFVESELETAWSKFLAVPGLLLTTVVSTLLAVAINRQWYIAGSSYDLIVGSWATVQIITYFMALSLGSIYTFAICNTINFYARLSLGRRPISLDWLSMWSSLSHPKIDVTLPTSAFFIIFALWGFTQLPTALWTGALTPVQTISLRRTPQATIGIPVWSNATYDLWQYRNLWYNGGKRVANRLGVFSYNPVGHRLGILLNDGSSASTQDGSIPLFKKNDNSNFTYQGRSYGVASSVGLVDSLAKEKDNINHFNYTETGYKGDISCFHNATSNFVITLIESGKNNTHKSNQYVPSIYWASGAAPYDPPLAPGEGLRGFPVTAIAEVEPMLPFPTGTRHRILLSLLPTSPSPLEDATSRSTVLSARCILFPRASTSTLTWHNASSA